VSRTEKVEVSGARLPDFLSPRQAAELWSRVTSCCPWLARQAGEQVWRKMCARGLLQQNGIAVLTAGRFYLISRDDLLRRFAEVGRQIAAAAEELRGACDHPCDTFSGDSAPPASPAEARVRR